MAEATGLAMGAVSLAMLFTTCVECLDYIDLARNHDRDYEVAVTKLILLKSRLNTWGQTLQVTNRGRERAALRDHWTQEQDTIGRCLGAIKMMFEEAGKLESRYGLKSVPASSDVVHIPDERRIHAMFPLETRSTSNTVLGDGSQSLRQKTRWAIRDKKKFDSMIAELKFLIDGLVDVSERLQALDCRQSFRRVEVRPVAEAQTLRLVEDASDQEQAQSQSRSTPVEGERARLMGHMYLDTTIKNRAKVINGNIGVHSHKSNTYQRTQVSDDAHAVQGDVSNDMALAFFR